MINEATIAGITVAGQPKDAELAELPAQGYGTVINVRMPEEQEEPEGPKVEALGMRYVSVPYTGQTMSREDVHKIREAIESAPPGSKTLTH
ncbi:MAG TPA: sulfur transferase domain-containing protein [Candidatus Baltobacteraceae bacterium]|jgi:uncharacterized protein (TIGR01244 family)